MDLYFKKDITYSISGQKFTFAVSDTLFSTFAVDYGTDLLLRYISANNPKTILDLGCGYGPIGIVLAKKYPNSTVTLADRDLLAIRYAQINLDKNGVSNATALGSVGMENVLDKKFDLVVSNVPAKIGDDAITEDFILKPYQHLNQNGELWVVVVNALNRLIPKIGTNHNLNVTAVKKGNGHTVYQIKKN